jgi:hypothetical protein
MPYQPTDYSYLGDIEEPVAMPGGEPSGGAILPTVAAVGAVGVIALFALALGVLFNAGLGAGTAAIVAPSGKKKAAAKVGALAGGLAGVAGSIAGGVAYSATDSNLAYMALAWGAPIGAGVWAAKREEKK